jgi:hypothetical protein
LKWAGGAPSAQRSVDRVADEARSYKDVALRAHGGTYIAQWQA